MSSAILSQLDLSQAIARHPLIVSPGTRVTEAIALMSNVRASCSLGEDADSEHQLLLMEAQASCVLVMDGEQLMGIVTERDVVHLSAQDRSLHDIAIAEIMHHPVITLRHSEFTSLFVPLHVFQQHHIRHLPIVDDDGQVMGLITHECLRHLLRPVDLLRLRCVSDVMTTQVIHANPTASVLHVAQLMATHRVSSVVIVERDAIVETDAIVGTDIITETEPSEVTAGEAQPPLHPIGIVTERDIVQFLALGLVLEHVQVQSVMSAPVFSVRADTSLWAARQLMQERRINRIIVTNAQNRLLGILTQTSLLSALNPLEIYKLVEFLGDKVSRLESENLNLLQSRNTELERQVQERTAELQVQIERERLLSSISSQIRASLDLPELLNIAVTEVRSLLKCDRVAIYQFQPDWSTIVVAESAASGLASYIGRTITDPCFLPDWATPYVNGRVRVVSDIYTADMADCHRELLKDLNIRAKILVPILHEDRLWGLLNAVETTAPREWQPGEANLVQQVGTQVAIAIQQATAYQQARTELAEKQKTEAILRQSEATNYAIVRAIPDLLIRMRKDGQYLALLNGSAVTVLYPNRNIRESTVHDVLQPGLAEERLVFAQRALETQSIQTYEQTIQINGMPHYEEVRVVPNGPDEVLVIIRDITARKQAEQALQESEHRLQQQQDFLRTVLDTNPNQIFVKNQAGRYLLANRTFAEFYGTTVEAIAGQTYRDLNPDADLVDAFQQQDQWVITHQQDLLLPEECFYHPVQGAQWLQWQKRPIYLPEHQQYGVLGVGVNITNRKLAEDALKSLVEGTAAVTGTDFFSALVKYIASALNVSHVIVTQKVGEDMQTLAFWSNGALQPNISYRLAQTPCEITLRQGQYCCLSNTPLAFPDAPALASLQIESYQGLALQNSSGDTIGSLCILDRQALPDPDKTAAILQVFAARASAELERLWATNALEQLTQELEIKVEERTAALRHSEERWQLALEAANYSIWDWDFRTNRVFRSKRWRDLRGFDDDDVSDRPEEWANTIHPDDYEQVMTAFADHFAGRSEFFELEYRVRRKDGSYIWILDRGKALQEENGQILRMLGSETDITQRKLAEADLKKTNEQLAIANVELARATRLKDEFLANMSHELRTPLNAILGLSEALQDDAFGTLNESQKRAMTTIEQSGRHLLELITDILDLSKIEAGKLELEVAAVSVHHLCESSLSFVRHQAMQKSIPITVNIPPDLERILVDERRMRQVLINLLNNAVKFTPAGGHVALDVTLESSAEQTSSLSTDAPTSAHDYLVFSILDTGIGIAPDDLGKLFQAFVQIDSSLNRQYSGTGLGLALVRRIVDLHNGTVTVSSTVGEGSCFTVRLPYVGVSAPLSPSSTVSQREEQARSLHSPPTELTSNSTVKSPLILLVDDHPANVEVISTYLKSCGYSIAIAHSGQSAIDTATAQPPDLIVMDIQMPGMDGLEAIRRIRVLPQLTHIPIIAFTALAMPRDREACLAAGANDYLAKPVLLKQLTAVIQRLLDNRSQSSR